MEFVEEHRVRELGLTGEDIVESVVKPYTAARKCRYTDILMEQGLSDQRLAGAVSRARPFFFVSHPWGRPFGEVLDLVLANYRERAKAASLDPGAAPLGDEYLWIDVFALNHHAGSSARSAELASVPEVVADAEETLVVVPLNTEGLQTVAEAWNVEVRPGARILGARPGRGASAEGAAGAAAGTSNGGATAAGAASGSPQESRAALRIPPSARPHGHLSRHAVSLAWLHRFAEDHRVRELGLTGEAVVERVVKRYTAPRRCRYTDLLAEQAHDDLSLAGAVSCGRPFFFVSHPWGRPFAEVLDLVDAHFGERAKAARLRHGATSPEPDHVFLWIDVFALNHHAGSSARSAELASVPEVVADAEETLVVVGQGGAALEAAAQGWHVQVKSNGGSVAVSPIPEEQEPPGPSDGGVAAALPLGGGAASSGGAAGAPPVLPVFGALASLVSAGSGSSAGGERDRSRNGTPRRRRGAVGGREEGLDSPKASLLANGL
ncbi:hypothetical protein HYH03_009968 [Edaphochlamys debaryana]|uniref:Uncharacterized protein n=1 Tax=Edaphochlamys debaryana TaxID=47281 RepID=A0A835XX30_9CHLO|nr:hypothetical protein HYH03_009968 [Edaphochlamys debaryana]|eukprot:KAG2491808.1 hypothetical protein HYH03_009968 [Edaphochlamys debaryana]